jgi:hypothetical protein
MPTYNPPAFIASYDFAALLSSVAGDFGSLPTVTS